MTAPRAPIVPVLLPHGRCLPGCPYCPRDSRVEVDQLIPDPVSVSAEIDRVLDHRMARGLAPVPVELAFFGGDLWQLPRGPRTELLDAAEWEVRRGRASSIRLTLSPRSVLRAPVAELRARGVRAVELPVHSLDRRVLRGLGSQQPARLGIEAVGRLNRARLRSLVTLSPGLPGSSHRSCLATVDSLLRASPRGVRLLPALVLEGTQLEDAWRAGWQPMSLAEAVAACRHALVRLRHKQVEILRVGLEPENDLQCGPEILAGPYDSDLRLLVEADLMRSRAVDALTSAFALGTRAFTFVVNPREENYLRGRCNENLRLLREQFRLESVHVVSSEEQVMGTLRVYAGQFTASDIPPGRPRKAS